MTKTISLTDEQHALMLHLLGYALQDLDDGPKVHALIEHVRAAAEPKAEPIYGSLTARDPNDVTRSPWTKTGWWYPAEKS